MSTVEPAAAGRAGARFIVPFLQHRGFVGRKDDLAKIHALLQRGLRVAVRPVAAAGMGGIGKTQMAVEYAYQHRDDYPGGVYWVNAAGDVMADIAALAVKAGLPEDSASESERQWRRVQAFAREIGGLRDALVIFDNVEDPVVLTNTTYGFVPAQLACRVLFTTRRRDDLRGTFALVPVGALPMEEALALLYKDAGRAEGDEDQVARDLCSLLGRLPLALALAGAYLAENPEVPLAAYRDRLRREGALAVDAADLEGDLPTRHDKAVEATLRVSWEATAKLPGGGKAERLVMTAAALVGEAAEVPKARLALLTGLRDREQQGYPAPLGKALRRLVTLSLVEELGEQDIRLHPLVREFAERQIHGREGFARECAARLGEVLWDLPRLDEAVRERGVDAVLGDLRFGAALGGEEATRWLGRLIRVLDREAHRLRRWDPEAAPEFLLQQVRNRCFELEEDEGCARAEQALGDRGIGWLRERVRVSRESEALVRTLEGHTNHVKAVAVTPDGRQVVSASVDKTLKVWDLGTGQLVRTLEGHTKAVTGVTVAPDGRHAVSASVDETFKVWEVGTGRLIHTLEGGDSPVAVTPDGRQAVSVSWDSKLKVWEVGTGRLVRILEWTTDGVEGVVMTPDGRQAVFASLDKTLKVWDLGSGQLVRTLEGHTDFVNGVAVTPDGQHAVSASDDNTLKVWDLGTGQLIRTLEGHMGGVNGVAVTPDGLQAVSASSDNTLKVWDLGSGQLVRSLQGHRAPVSGVAVTPDGRQVVSASMDWTLKVWNLGSEQLVHTLEWHTNSVNGAALTPDARQAISASGPLVRLKLTANGRYAVSSNDDGTLGVWVLASGQLICILGEHPEWVNGMAVTPDERHAISVSVDETLDMSRRESESHSIVYDLEEHRSWVNDVAVTPDGLHAVSASEDKTLKVWDLGTRQLVRTLEGHTDDVNGVAMTPDGLHVISASSDATLAVWDLATGRRLATLETHAGLGACAAASNRTFLAADAVGGLHILDWLPDGRLLSTLAPPPRLPSPVAPFRPRAPQPIIAEHPNMPFDRHLPDADLAALHTIALDLRLTDSRRVLLGGLDRRYVDGLPIEPAPTMQLMSDLQHLNACEHLGEPSSRVIPLARWLATAHHLTSVHPQAARFKQAQEQIERQAREPAGEAAAPPVQAPAPAPAAVVTPSAPVKQAAEARPLRWLHISDIHLGLEDGYGHDIVLRALVDAFRDGGTLADRRPDVIFCTGDIAQSGKPAQYVAAGKLFEDLARATGTPMDRIFVVPGNHDLDRTRVARSFVLQIEDREAADLFFGPEGIDDREIAFRRFAAFADFQRERWNLPLTAARPFLLTRCRVGSEVLDVIGLNTAWLAHQDEAQGKLILGERLLRQALDELDKAAEPATVRVALFHHPLDWLRDFEREAIQDLLAEGVDFALHGHLHAQRPTQVSAPTGSVAVLAAGAAYQGRKWPATALLVELAATEARVEAIMFREHAKGIWMRDAILNPRGDGVFRIPRRAAAARG